MGVRVGGERLPYRLSTGLAHSTRAAIQALSLDGNRARAGESRMKEREPEKERIAKFLARAGVASRRDSERLINAGRITLNGVVVAHPATLVTSADTLTIDGKDVAPPQRTK